MSKRRLRNIISVIIGARMMTSKLLVLNVSIVPSKVECIVTLRHVTPVVGSMFYNHSSIPTTTVFIPQSACHQMRSPLIIFNKLLNPCTHLKRYQSGSLNSGTRFDLWFERFVWWRDKRKVLWGGNSEVSSKLKKMSTLSRKFLNSRKRNGQIEHFVKWRGYAYKFNSWTTSLLKL
jgi:hypothetical protein